MNEESKGHGHGGGPSIRSRPESKLLVQHAIDEQDGTDKFMSENFRFYLQKVGTLSEKEAIDTLLNVEKSEFERMHYGLIYGILTEPNNAQKYFSHLATITSAPGRGEPWAMSTYAMSLVIDELFHKMLKHVRYQFLFLFKEAMRLDVNQLDGSMLEFVRGLGDVFAIDERNALYDQFLGLLEANRQYLHQLKPTLRRGHNQFVSYIVHTCTHLICDLPPNGPFEPLRTKAIDLLNWSIKNRVQDVGMLGRDFILTLMRGSKVKEISTIFEDLLNGSNRFEPFQGFEDFKSRSPCLTLQRVSPSLQKKLQFFYQIPRNSFDRIEWFWKLLEDDYLRPHGEDNGWLRGEILRYLLYSQPPAPQEQQIQLDVKLNILTLLFLQVKQESIELQWMKMCLWFDWLTFVPPQPGKQIQPQMLGPLQLTWNFIRACFNSSQLAIITLGNSCLQFLLKAAELVCPKLAPKFQESCVGALSLLRETQGMNFISQVLDNARVDRSYRNQLREYFKDFVRQPTVPTPTSSEPQLQAQPQVKLERPAPAIEDAEEANEVRDKFTQEKKKEREEHDREMEKRQITNRAVLEADVNANKESRMQSLKEVMELLVPDIREAITKIRDVFNDPSNDAMKRSEEIQELIMTILRTESVVVESEQLELVGQAVHYILGPLVSWVDSALPENPNPDNLEECFNAPINVFFRNVVRRTHDDPTHRNAIIQLIAALRDNNSAVGYLLLFFLKYETLSKDSSDPTSLDVYSDIAPLADVEVEEMLADDLQECAVTDIRLFSYLLPFVYRFKEACGNVKLLRVACKFSDPTDILKLISEITKENMTVFKRTSFANLLMSTADWEITEQWVMWQLVHGQGISVEWCLPLVSRVDAVRHQVLATNLLLMFRRLEREPNMAMIKAIFQRPCDSNDQVAIDMLKILIADEEVCIKVCEIINSIFEKGIQGGDYLLQGGKQKLGQKQTKLTLEQVVAHLQNFAHRCLYKDSHQAEDFLSRSELRDAFTLITKSKENWATKLREKYSDIFTTVMELRGGGEIATRNLRHGRRAGGQKRERGATASESDEVHQPRPKKSQKNVIESEDEDD
ncbi:unnamed protein product, partial [Mesorhabditis belari]|uniref:SOSS complex subunit A homolog n=1 Tax=Mesorhabditis belari TaxID=2138241 RepID=A0AAF3F4L0_9BILA